MHSISVLITYYNEQQWLTECLESVFAQTVLPNEVLIYEDAGPSCAADYLPTNPLSKSVRIIRGEKNVGLSAARNVLMKEAASDYTRYLDADDLLEPNCIETLRNAMQTHPAAVYVNEIRSVKMETGKPLSAAVLELYKLKSDEAIVSFAIRGCLLPGATTFRRALGLQLGGFKAGELLQAEDYEFNVRLVHKADSVHIIRKPLMIQRHRDGSMSKNAEQCYLEGVKAVKLLSQQLPGGYEQDLAVRMSEHGKILYKIGNHKAALDAFNTAKKLSPTVHVAENWMYRLLTKSLGQMTAEKVTKTYRQLLPRTLRSRLRTSQ